jgi:hypothetical protein
MHRNAKVAGSNPAWTKFFYVCKIYTVKKIYFFFALRSKELTCPSLSGRTKVPICDSKSITWVDAAAPFTQAVIKSWT